MDGTANELPAEMHARSDRATPSSPGIWSQIDSLVRNASVGGLAGVAASGLLTFTSVPFTDRASWLCAAAGVVVGVAAWASSLARRHQHA